MIYEDDNGHEHARQVIPHTAPNARHIFIRLLGWRALGDHAA